MRKSSVENFLDQNGSLSHASNTTITDLTKMQPKPTTDDIRRGLSGLSELYNRLLLVVGPSGSGKSALLRTFAAQDEHPVINVSLELTRRLLSLTTRQRILELPTILEDVMSVYAGTALVILDNIEILFDSSLKQDPLRLLLAASRNRTIISSWLGAVEGDYLTFASPTHPDFRRYRADELVLISLSSVSR